MFISKEITAKPAPGCRSCSRVVSVCGSGRSGTRASRDQQRCLIRRWRVSRLLTKQTSRLETRGGSASKNLWVIAWLSFDCYPPFLPPPPPPPPLLLLCCFCHRSQWQHMHIELLGVRQPSHTEAKWEKSQPAACAGGDVDGSGTQEFISGHRVGSSTEIWKDTMGMWWEQVAIFRSVNEWHFSEGFRWRNKKRINVRNTRWPFHQRAVFFFLWQVWIICRIIRDDAGGEICAGETEHPFLSQRYVIWNTKGISSRHWCESDWSIYSSSRPPHRCSLRLQAIRKTIKWERQRVSYWLTSHSPACVNVTGHQAPII